MVRPDMTQSLENILQQRRSTHGDFKDHAQVTQEIKRAMFRSKNWEKLTCWQREALEMEAHKIGRILSGDPNYKDHWDDMAGYAKLVAGRIE
jgi:recombinational DNA repair protein RecT